MADAASYTGWKELKMCHDDGHKCPSWLTLLYEVEDDYAVENNIYVEVAVPELNPEPGVLQKFLIVGSYGDSSNVTIFLGGKSITVSSDNLRRACYRATDVSSG